MKSRPVMLGVVARPLYAAVLAAAAGLLLRGHDQPGGGFVGGLLAVAATSLWAVAHGPESAGRRLPLRSPVRLASAGVLLAAGSGLPASWRGAPYLTHLWADLPLGIITLPISTALVFDVGVFLAVWGALGGYALALLDLTGDEGEAGP